MGKQRLLAAGSGYTITRAYQCSMASYHVQGESVLFVAEALFGIKVGCTPLQVSKEQCTIKRLLATNAELQSWHNKS